MRKLTALFLSLGILAAPCALAGEQDKQDEQAALSDIGGVLGWRLGPEAVEEHCSTVDPPGVEARHKAIEAWRLKNSLQIRAVDDRVAEVAPLLAGAPKDVVDELHAQVKQMIIEETFTDKRLEVAKAICEKVRDPADIRWNSNGMPMVQVSLAALYDWKLKQTTKASAAGKAALPSDK